MSAAAKPAALDEGPPASEERTSDLDPIRAAMERAPRVQWLSPEERAECDKALADLRAGRSKLLSHEEMFEDFEEIARAQE